MFGEDFGIVDLVELDTYLADAQFCLRFLNNLDIIFRSNGAREGVESTR